ncbi:NAD(P)H-dependent oxidoreductase [Niveibacterium sp. 24ML]|uniref:flavodoxin family protein n=1 Tax=Niveibacterium sp. 24ML TaxID=2985512 RepID=UPI00226F9045|nr:NAD(P)H-dependent oxidoreductase [Niveibacterium sp. 24ML]MCX9156322.1 NAD(P)H-dependent oxidoreductase [Niveibacterium sp. 24ML]
MTTDPMKSFLFLSASTREPGHTGNTETLARIAAAALPDELPQRWISLAQCQQSAFVDLRHTAGHYPAPEGDAAMLLEATLAASDIVFVSPVYWFSVPSPMKTYLDQWSAWMRVPGVDFKARMAEKRLWVIATSGDRDKAQPMFDSYRLCAEFLGMQWMGPLWGKGGAPDAVLADTHAIEAAKSFLLRG